MANEIMETLKLEIESLKNTNKKLACRNNTLYRKNKNLTRTRLRLKNQNYNLVKYIDNIDNIQNIETNIKPYVPKLKPINENDNENTITNEITNIDKINNIQLEWDYIEDIDKFN